jgi:hypothetical protein
LNEHRDDFINIFLAVFTREKLLINVRMEPAVGVEPTTGGLRNRCSTTEPRWHPRYYMRMRADGKGDTGMNEDLRNYYGDLLAPCSGNKETERRISNSYLHGTRNLGF